MSKDCSELQAIIEELIADIEKVKEIWCGIRADNPTFEQVSEENWESKEALLWMHGETKTFEAIELERWLFSEPPISETSKSDANDNYLAWIDHLREDGIYSEFDVDDLPKPLEKESLVTYVTRLSQYVSQKGWGIKRQRRALKSFLSFLRQDYKQEDVAFIEHIFPAKSDLMNQQKFKKISLPSSFHLGGFSGRALIKLSNKVIIRKIWPQVEAISHQVAGEIIKELAYQCAFGRKNARHHAGEALALIWLCISSSRIRWPRSLESVHELSLDAIVYEKEYPELLAPSFFGPHPVRIGSRVARFLQTVANIPSKKPRKTILQTPLKDLRDRFRKTLKIIKLPQDLGEITFLTFLSYPHHFGKEIR